MKNAKKLAMWAGAMLAMAIAMQHAQADPIITGEINMDGSITLNSADTEATAISGYVASGTQTYVDGTDRDRRNLGRQDRARHYFSKLARNKSMIFGLLAPTVTHTTLVCKVLPHLQLRFWTAALTALWSR